MRILVIPSTDWIRHPVPNRLNFIFDILARDHEVFVLHFPIGQFSAIEPRATSCRLVKSGMLPVKDPSLFYLLNAPFHLFTLIRVIRKQKIEVVLSANVLPSLLATICRVPIVFDYLDHLEESASIYYPGSLIGKLVKGIVKSITKYNLSHSSSIITVTPDFYDYLTNAGFSGVHVIPNGVDTSELREVPMPKAKNQLNLQGPVIGYIGSLEYWVDLEMVIEALPSLDVILLVVGPGLFTDYGNLVHALAKEKGVTDRVIFTGLIPFRELSLYISAMDIGLNPLKNMAKNEMTVGGKVFNYLACGKPVLSSRMHALERMLGDALFYYDDPESFAGQVRAILAAPGDPVRYRRLASEYDWEGLSVQYEKVLKSALPGAHSDGEE
jgi:glycosyltransferase involved in cell wall biosynthesis